ncbi:hypothetical protein SDC9_165360 [bioreactor metagenome]|uniref:Uncharacterized protein n=1 Tax=bioreactor metagenome TaxID=1076179 RepID=A0A645FWD7_9ZZZZ
MGGVGDGAKACDNAGVHDKPEPQPPLLNDGVAANGENPFADGGVKPEVLKARQV